MGNSMGGHQSPVNATDTWLTPTHILNELGTFDLDPCGAPTPRPWPTATRHICLPTDGLDATWYGRVWLNPPYGGPAIIGPWMAKMARHQNGTALVFARTETAVFHRYVWKAATAILFLEGRLFFCDRNGVAAKHNAGAPSCLVAYSTFDAATLESCSLKGAFVRL